MGIATGDMGVTREGEHGPNYAPGMELRAAYTLFGEGCRGSLAKQLMARFDLRKGVDPQTYGLGIKELWEIPAAKHRPGLVQHSFGWPLDGTTYGGSWLYHFGENLVSYGFVVGLDYANTWLSPFDEMQRLKTHPSVRKHLEGGKRLSYGARALSEGGLQSVPRLSFPGGALLGDSAGFLNVPKIKGTHTAMKSGMLAAEAVAEALANGRPAEPRSYTRRVRASWLWTELRDVRNVRPSFAKLGTLGGALYSGFDAMVLRGRAPWTLRHRHADHEILNDASASPPIAYPKPDNKLTFDRLSSVYLVQHQPRGKPAGASAAARSWALEERELGPLPVAGEPVLPGRGVRGGGYRGRHCVRPAAADQRAELRALQDLRHQGPDAEYRLGGTRGRRRPELSRRHVESTRKRNTNS